MTQNFADPDDYDGQDDSNDLDEINMDDLEQVDLGDLDDLYDISDLIEEDPQQQRLEEVADQWLAGAPPVVDERELIAPRDQLGSVDLEEVLGLLIGDPQELAVEALRAFSDLPREQAAVVGDQWPSIPVERRREILRYLIQAVDEDITWQLGRFFRIALNDSDAEVRRYAIEGLWDDNDGRLIGPLIQILLNDADELVRAAAADALGSYVLAGELEELDAALAMRVEEALLAIVSNESEPSRVRASALKSLAYSGEVGVRQLIEDAYYAPEDDLRISSLVAMGRSADVRWRSLARAELQNPWDEVRAAAAQACGELEAKAALDMLIELVSDESHAVKVAAIMALGRIGGKDAREVLEAVRLDEEEELVEAADFALEELMFFASGEGEMALLDESDETPDEWDIEPWHRGQDLDESDFGTYEE